MGLRVLRGAEGGIRSDRCIRELHRPVVARLGQDVLRGQLPAARGNQAQNRSQQPILRSTERWIAVQSSRAVERRFESPEPHIRTEAMSSKSAKALRRFGRFAVILI